MPRIMRLCAVVALVVALATAATLAMLGLPVTAFAVDPPQAQPVADHRAALGSAVDPGESVWEWPVEQPLRIVSPYRAPATPYGPGHRGIDLVAHPDGLAIAPADGIVSFNGMVAGRPVLSIDHGDGVVSSMEPVSGLVPAGAPVAAGEIVGRVAAGGHCDGSCLHFGVRVDGEYVSPLRFLGGVPRAVLLPMG